MSEPYQRMLSGYGVYKTRANTLACIVRLEPAIERRVRTYRAIKAERSPASEERRKSRRNRGCLHTIAKKA